MKSKLFSLALALMSLIFVSSCGDTSSTSSILERIPHNYDVVAVGNANTILESLGASVNDSQLQLPSYITSQLSRGDMRSVDELNKILKKAGVEISMIALAGNYDEDTPVIVCSLSDTGKFHDFITDEGYEIDDDESDATIYRRTEYEGSYYSRYSFIAVKDAYAYYLPEQRSENGAAVLGSFIADAAAKSFATTPIASRLAESSVGGVSLKLTPEVLRHSGELAQYANLLAGYVCITIDLNGDKATAKLKLYNNDATEKQLAQGDQHFDVTAKISSKALAYMHPDEMFVGAISLKGVNWSGILDKLPISNSDRNSLRMVTPYLSKIDGTIAFGLGFKDGICTPMKFNYRKGFDEIVATFVCETKDGEAKKLVDELKTMIGFGGIPYTATANGFSITIPEVDITVHVAADDNLLIASTCPIEAYNSNEAVKRSDICSYSFGLAAAVKANDKLTTQLGLHSDISASILADFSRMELVFNLQVSGDGSTGILGNIVKAAIDFMGNLRQLDDLSTQVRRQCGAYYRESLYSNPNDDDDEYYDDDDDEYYDDVLF